MYVVLLCHNKNIAVDRRLYCDVGCPLVALWLPFYTHSTYIVDKESIMNVYLDMYYTSGCIKWTCVSWVEAVLCE